MSENNRENDLRMLREALELPKLEDSARDAFSDMLEQLESQRHHLSDAQRAWLRSVLDEPDYVNMVSTGKVARKLEHNHGPLAECRAQCPMWTPPTLRNLPKHPPKRS